MSKSENRCRGTNAQGVSCGSPFVGADGFCTAHREGGTVEMRRRGLKGAIAARKAAVRGLDPEELGSLTSFQDAKHWLEVLGRSVAGGKLGDRAALAAIKAVSEWIKAEGERLTADVLPELQKQIDELREQAEDNRARLRSV